MPLRSIGLRPATLKTFGAALLGTVAMLAVFTVHYAMVIPAPYLDPSGAAAEPRVILAMPYQFRWGWCCAPPRSV